MNIYAIVCPFYGPQLIWECISERAKCPVKSSLHVTFKLMQIHGSKTAKLTDMEKKPNVGEKIPKYQVLNNRQCLGKQKYCTKYIGMYFPFAKCLEHFKIYYISYPFNMVGPVLSSYQRQEPD